MHTPDDYGDMDAILSQAGAAEEDEHDFAIVTVCIRLSSSLPRAKSKFLFV